MGCDCVNYLPRGIKLVDVAEFLSILGYPQGNFATIQGKPIYACHFYKDEDYKYFSGVEVLAYLEGEAIHIETRTSIWRTKWDSDFHNFTVKQLQKRFGGTFISDFGKGRYLRYKGQVSIAAEAGCYFAFFRLRNDFSSAHSFLGFVKEAKNQVKMPVFPKELVEVTHRIDPIIISTNLFLPFLVSIIEEYFKSTYIALLKYSPRKSSVIKSARIPAEELTSISNGEQSMEEAITKSMSFQNIGKVCTYFKELDSKLDLYGTLKKPYRRRRESMFDTFDRILHQRHELIHQSKMNPNYTIEMASRDVETVRVAVTRVYNYLINTYEWQQ